MIDTGTATAGISVARQSRRNANTTRITSTTAISSARSVSASEALMVGERSSAVLMLTEPGSAALSCGIASLTPCTALMMFAPGWRYRITVTAWWPLYSPALRTSSTLSSTSATSLSRTARPLR